MLTLKIYSVGKIRDSWLLEGIAEYEKRLSPWVKIESLWEKDNAALMRVLNPRPRALIGLDSRGRQFSSEEFATFLMQEWENHGSQIAFLIGGAEGIPDALKTQIPLISLSKMTFTHHMTHLLVREQIYRAISIAKSMPYHK